jgi:hypothetical protein
MAVKADIINSIKARLLKYGAAKTVDIFNENVTHDNKESYDLPAVFVEFAGMPYLPYQKGTQKGEFIIALNIIVDDYNRDLDKLFDPIELVHQYIEGFTPTGASGKMTRTSEDHDTDHERLVDWVAFYDVPVHDASGDSRNLLESGTVVLELTKCIGSTILVTPIQGSDKKLVNLIYEEGGDNSIEFTATLNQSGTYTAATGVNTASIVIEVDTGAGYNVVTPSFVVQVGDLVKITITRTDAALQSSVTLDGIA